MFNKYILRHDLHGFSERIDLQKEIQISIGAFE